MESLKPRYVEGGSEKSEKCLRLFLLFFSFGLRPGRLLTPAIGYSWIYPGPSSNHNSNLHNDKKYEPGGRSDEGLKPFKLRPAVIDQNTATNGNCVKRTLNFPAF